MMSAAKRLRVEDRGGRSVGLRASAGAPKMEPSLRTADCPRGGGRCPSPSPWRARGVA